MSIPLKEDNFGIKELWQSQQENSVLLNSSVLYHGIQEKIDAADLSFQTRRTCNLAKALRLKKQARHHPVLLKLLHECYMFLLASCSLIHVPCYGFICAPSWL